MEGCDTYVTKLEFGNILASDTMPILCKSFSLKQFRESNMETFFQVQFNTSKKEANEEKRLAHGSQSCISKCCFHLKNGQIAIVKELKNYRA